MMVVVFDTGEWSSNCPGGDGGVVDAGGGSSGQLSSGWWWCSMLVSGGHHHPGDGEGHIIHAGGRSARWWLPLLTLSYVVLWY